MVSQTMIEVTITEFKVNCSALLEQIRRTRQRIQVTRDGKPLAEVIPHPPVQHRAAWIASMKNSITIKGDSISPANDEEEWEALRDIGEESEAKGTDKLKARKMTR
jgi:antitoxin (DNA-binding transcriptional repressor) of toxin-antitoxin stability system